VRECAAQLTRFAKTSGTSLVFVGHVTKEGAIAGPRVLEHMVDSVLYFEGDTHSSFRLVRAIKNRFGAVNELGVFAMTDKGLRGVTNPSAPFLPQHAARSVGSCVLVTQEGTRPLLVEIQLWTSRMLNARRSRWVWTEPAGDAAGGSHRHAGVAAFDQDVLSAWWRGERPTNPRPIRILFAIVFPAQRRCRSSSWRPAKGMAGEIRPVQRGQERLREAAKL
jgi:DNA repair protein RadA/Sms